MRLVLSALALALLAACSGGPSANNGAAANAAAPANQATPAGPATTPISEAAAFLPAPGSHPARAMMMSVPPEAEALATRMTTAIRANFAWYRAYAAQHPQGELPWHPNLGISQAEYARFQTLTGQISLRETARVTLNVTRRPDGGLTLAAAGPAAPLDGIILYPERGRI